jgi:hypothetical protein
MTELDGSTVYLWGLTLVHVCACAPAAMPPDQVEAQVNTKTPTGIESPWQVDTEPVGDGAPNPRPCNSDPDGRLHYLMVC